MCDKWIDITEEFPLPNTGILVTDGIAVTACEMHMEKHGPRGQYRSMTGHEFGGYEMDFDIDADKVTHWMLLPLPPNKEAPHMPTPTELRAMTEHNNLHRDLHAEIANSRKGFEMLMGIVKSLADELGYELVVTKQGGGMVKAEWVGKSPIVRL